MVRAKQGGDRRLESEQGFAACDPGLDPVGPTMNQIGLRLDAEFGKRPIITCETFAPRSRLAQPNDNADPTMALLKEVPSSPVGAIRVGLKHGVETILAVTANCSDNRDAVRSDLLQEFEIAAR